MTQALFERPAPTLADAQDRYGKIIGSAWPQETRWCSLMPIPSGLSQWMNTATSCPVVHIYCNKDMQPALWQALCNVRDRGYASQLKTFDGCFMVRDVRGEAGMPSTHSYGLAIDINAAENRLGEKPTIAPEFAACFTDAGFSWGATFHRCDGMHFSFAWE